MTHPLDKPIRTCSFLLKLLLVLIALGLSAAVASAHELAFTWPEQEWDIALPSFDTEKLCRAIAVAETSACTTGMALTKHNCHGIMTWKDGSRTGRTFASFEESQAACVDLWNRKYQTFPTIEQARLYTGGDDAERWLSVVTSYYHP